jgi:hypothetical protein
MADPITLLAVGATIAGGTLAAAGQLQGGKAGYEMGRFREAIARQNALYEIQIGERRAGELGLKQAQRSIIPAQAAGGLDVRSGSAVEVQKSQYAVNQIEQQDVRAAAGSKARAENIQGDIDLATGKQMRTASYYQAGATVLGTVGSAAGKWYQGRQLGMYGSGSGIDTGVGLSPFGGSSMFS